MRGKGLVYVWFNSRNDGKEIESNRVEEWQQHITFIGRLFSTMEIKHLKVWD